MPLEKAKITVAVVFHSLHQSTIHFSLTEQAANVGSERKQFAKNACVGHFKTVY